MATKSKKKPAKVKFAKPKKPLRKPAPKTAKPVAKKKAPSAKPAPKTTKSAGKKPAPQPAAKSKAAPLKASTTPEVVTAKPKGGAK